MGRRPEARSPPLPIPTPSPALISNDQQKQENSQSRPLPDDNRIEDRQS